MENYSPPINLMPIHNIIKSHLVIFHHSDEKLCAAVIDRLALKMTETIQSFLEKTSNEKQVNEVPVRLMKI